MNCVELFIGHHIRFESNIDTNCKRLCCKNNFSFQDCPIRKQISRPVELKQKWVAPLKRNPLRWKFTSIYSIGKWINGAKKVNRVTMQKVEIVLCWQKGKTRKVFFYVDSFHQEPLLVLLQRQKYPDVRSNPTHREQKIKVKVSAKFIVRTWFLGVGIYLSPGLPSLQAGQSNSNLLNCISAKNNPPRAAMAEKINSIFFALKSEGPTWPNKCGPFFVCSGSGGIGKKSHHHFSPLSTLQKNFLLLQLPAVLLTNQIEIQITCIFISNRNSQTDRFDRN